MTALWLVLTTAGLVVAARSSAAGVERATRAAAGLGVPAFVIGFTLVAVATDLPEVANSIVASVRGHGDVNTGDSIGSAFAQGTLVVGLLPLLAGPLRFRRGNVLVLGLLAVAVLLLGAVLTGDGRLARGDGAVLVTAWALSMLVAWRRTRPAHQPELPLPSRTVLVDVGAAAGWFVLVAIGATVAVAGLTRIAEALAVPEFVLSFLGLAIGTSLPELAVAATAARQGRHDLALGDVLGATLADASLSLGIGPLIAPTAVTAAFAVAGGLVAAVGVGVTTLVLVARGRHDRWTGLLLVATWVVAVPLVAAAA